MNKAFIQAPKNAHSQLVSNPTSKLTNKSKVEYAMNLQVHVHFRVRYEVLTFRVVHVLSSQVYCVPLLDYGLFVKK